MRETQPRIARAIPVGRDARPQTSNLHKHVTVILDYEPMDRAFSYPCEEVAPIVPVDGPRHEPGDFARGDRNTRPSSLQNSEPIARTRNLARYPSVDPSRE